jgi:glutamate N-acetyltransferase/amino-acid N-acetyltransferase
LQPISQNTPIDMDKNFKLFCAALNLVCLELAKMIVRDAEGASKFIRIKVDKAKSFIQARKIALAIANSNLFKTAIYAESPNFFGRVVAAAGASGMDINEKTLKIKSSPLRKKEINIDVSVNTGRACAVIYTCDLTHEYIKINSEYN